MRDLAELYRGRTILVTGHTGFKGGWLCTWLSLLGARVIGASLPSGSPLAQEALFRPPVAREYEIDIRDAEATLAMMVDEAPDLIIHFAAQSLVRRAHAMPLETFAINVMGTAHVMEAARSLPSLCGIVVATTDKVYRNAETSRRFIESDPLGDHAPYNGSKACTELVAEVWQRSYLDAQGVGVAVVRAGNVIGGGDWAEDRLIPDLVRAFSTNRQATLRRPDAVRPWQHVLDALHAYLLLGGQLLARNNAANGAWNVGPDDKSHQTVLDLATRFAIDWPHAEVKIQPDTNGSSEAHLLYLDSSKLWNAFDCRPRLDLATATKWTSDWYREMLLGNQDAVELTRRQIMNYQTGDIS
jgi:CDP-glucose 4,6-dehydratase